MMKNSNAQLVRKLIKNIGTIIFQQKWYHVLQEATRYSKELGRALRVALEDNLLTLDSEIKCDYISNNESDIPKLEFNPFESYDELKVGDHSIKFAGSSQLMYALLTGRTVRVKTLLEILDNIEELLRRYTRELKVGFRYTPKISRSSYNNVQALYKTLEAITRLIENTKAYPKIHQVFGKSIRVSFGPEEIIKFSPRAVKWVRKVLGPISGETVAVTEESLGHISPKVFSELEMMFNKINTSMSSYMFALVERIAFDYFVRDLMEEV